MQIMDLRRVLASNVKARRRDRHWSQTELAAKAGIVQSHVSRTERMESGVTVDVVAGLAQAFGCQPFELLVSDEATRREALERMINPRLPEEAGHAALPPPREERPPKRAAHRRRARK